MNPRDTTALWQPLLAPALVGTDRHPPVRPGLPAAMEPSLGALLTAVESATADPATRLLRWSAALSLSLAAGVQGASAGRSADAETSVGHADPETPADLPALPAGAAEGALAWTLREGPLRLQLRFLRAVAQAGWRLPTPLLPLALDGLSDRRCADEPVLRSALVDTLGRRGRWLAHQRDDWRQALSVTLAEQHTRGTPPPDETAWSLGTPAERAAFLRAERSRDPAAARERLVTEAASLPARERAQWVAMLAEGLSEADAPALNTWTRDRSREVRGVAQGLLLRLPGNAMSQRAAEVVRPWLQAETDPKRAKKSAVPWTLEPPETADEAWTRDGIELARPQGESLGDRAWTLSQWVRRLPLSWWTQETGAAPADLLDWAARSDWSEALLRAWREVLLATADSDWVEALLARWPRKGWAHDPAPFIALLPWAQREPHWMKQLGATAPLTPQQRLRSERWRSGLLPEILAACPVALDLSAALSEAMLPLIQGALRDPNIVYDPPLRQAVTELCCVLDGAVLPALAAVVATGNETPAHAETLQTVAHIVRARQHLQGLPASPFSPPD